MLHLTENKLDVSIIVVGYNTKDLVLQCLESIYRETKQSTFEVVYVDNDSNDESANTVRKKYPQVTIIENDSNLGFSRANNQGIKQSIGRYILLLNSDTIIIEDAISRAIRFADSRMDAAVIGCKVEGVDGIPQKNCFMSYSTCGFFLMATYLYKVFPKNKHFAKFEMPDFDFEVVQEVENISGCFLLARRTAIEDVGLLDERMFFYAEDLDWCYRFRKNNWKIFYTPEARIVHLGGQSTKKARMKFIHQSYGSQLLYVRKHYGRSTFIYARILTLLFFFVRIPFWLFRVFFVSSERDRSLEYLRAYMYGCFYTIIGWPRLLINAGEVNKSIASEKKRSGEDDAGAR